MQLLNYLKTSYQTTFIEIKEFLKTITGIIDKDYFKIWKVFTIVSLVIVVLGIVGLYSNDYFNNQTCAIDQYLSTALTAGLLIFLMLPVYTVVGGILLLCILLLYFILAPAIEYLFNSVRTINMPAFRGFTIVEPSEKTKDIFFYTVGVLAILLMGAATIFIIYHIYLLFFGVIC